MRVAAVQSWPQLAKAPTIAPSAAASTSASSKTTNGALPPISMCTRLSEPAASRITRAAGALGAGDRDQRDVGVAGQRAADLGPVAADDVEHAAREPGPQRQLGQHQRGQRGELGRLEDDRVAGRQRGADLPRRHVERVVPRGDRGAHAERLAHDRGGEALDVLAGRPALEVAAGGGEEAQVVDGEREVERARETQRLAGVAALRARELVGVVLEQVGEPVEHRRALGGGDAAPVAAPVGGAGRGDRALGIGGAALGDLGERRARARVDDRARATALQRLAVHEHPPRTHVVSDGHATPPLRPSTLADPAGCRNGRIGVCSGCQRAATALAAGGERREHGEP